MKGKTALLLIAALLSVMFLVNADWERPSSPVARIFAHNNVSQDILSDNTWQNITFDDEDANGTFITHSAIGVDNTTFTVQLEGLYNIQLFITVEDTAPNPVSNAAVELRRNEMSIDGSRVEVDLTRQNAEVEISTFAHMPLNVGDVITALVITDTAATVGLSVHDTFGDTESAVFEMIRIGEIGD
ncbi:hypothetical protein LCGC14_2333170 [marine sediment metagenome]|uniref:Uncharacterized protein n=1 Tax=marine sediment metagenome TaxID=412755 RepID=A0A0F9CF25_9ZZZZ